MSELSIPEERAISRLAQRVEMPDGADGCWLYLGHREHGGYGQFTFQYRSRIVHRLAYELLVEPVDEGLQLDHLCRVRHCINPDHLEPVTPQENTARGTGTSAMNARKTHCLAGHEFSAENTYYDPNGHRECRTCTRAKHRRLRAAKAERRLIESRRAVSDAS